MLQSVPPPPRDHAPWPWCGTHDTPQAASDEAAKEGGRRRQAKQCRVGSRQGHWALVLILVLLRISNGISCAARQGGAMGQSQSQAMGNGGEFDGERGERSEESAPTGVRGLSHVGSRRRSRRGSSIRVG